MAYKGTHIDDSNAEEIPDGKVVTVVVSSQSSGETKTFHLSTDSWDDALEESDTLSSAFFND